MFKIRFLLCRLRKEKRFYTSLSYRAQQFFSNNKNRRKEYCCKYSRFYYDEVIFYNYHGYHRGYNSTDGGSRTRFGDDKFSFFVNQLLPSIAVLNHKLLFRIFKSCNGYTSSGGFDYDDEKFFKKNDNKRMNFNFNFNFNAPNIGIIEKFANLNEFTKFQKRSISYLSFKNFHEIEENRNSLANFSEDAIQNGVEEPIQLETKTIVSSESSDAVHPLAENDQLNILTNLEKNGKYNEIFIHFQNFKKLNLPVNLEIYNKTLKSISLREIKNESIEDKLTNLLNTYTDMLNNNIKPNLVTCELVLFPLFKGAVESFYIYNNFDQANQFFKVGLSLFNIYNENNYKFDPKIYDYFLVCLSLFGNKTVNLELNSTDLYNKLKRDNLLYYLTFLKLSNNYNFTMKIYNQFKINSIDYSSLLSNQFLIYEYLISSLIKISKIDKATKILDEIFISLRKNPEIFDKVAQRLISCYLLEISYKDLNKAEEIFLKFDSIPWLPDFTVSSQLNIIKNCILFNQFKLINFFWDYTVIRDDFDKGATTKSSHNSTNIGTNHLTDLLIYETSRVENMNIFTDLLALAFKNQHELNPLKFLKESTLKKSLVINDEEVLIKSLVYLLNFENSDNFILSFIIDQGYKSKLSKNQYLSLVVDYIPPKLYTKFISSEFFKQCCDDYKLIDDNIYGIYKIFNYIWGFQPITPDVKLETEIMKKLRHYYRILFSEMDDLINYYVEIPDQLKEFKSILKQKLNA